MPFILKKVKGTSTSRKREETCFALFLLLTTVKNLYIIKKYKTLKSGKKPTGTWDPRNETVMNFLGSFSFYISDMELKKLATINANPRPPKKACSL